MKFVRAIVVVAIHTRPELSFKSTFITELFEALYSIAVPFFFMDSGFLLFRKIELPLNKEGKVRIKSYLKRMCKLYLVWTIFYLPLTIYKFLVDTIVLVSIKCEKIESRCSLSLRVMSSIIYFVHMLCIALLVLVFHIDYCFLSFLVLLHVFCLLLC